MASAKKYTSTKVNEIVGNAPIDHSTRLRHFETNSTRQQSLNGCFGSSLMNSCMGGGYNNIPD